MKIKENPLLIHNDLFLNLQPVLPSDILGMACQHMHPSSVGQLGQHLRLPFVKSAGFEGLTEWSPFVDPLGENCIKGLPSVLWPALFGINQLSFGKLLKNNESSCHHALENIPKIFAKKEIPTLSLHSIKALLKNYFPKYGIHIQSPPCPLRFLRQGFSV